MEAKDNPLLPLATALVVQGVRFALASPEEAEAWADEQEAAARSKPEEG